MNTRKKPETKQAMRLEAGHSSTCQKKKMMAKAKEGCKEAQVPFPKGKDFATSLQWTPLITAM